MEYFNIISNQRNFFNSNASKELSFRKAQLIKLRTLLKSNEKRLYEAIDADFKKGEFETYATELGLLYTDIAEALKKMRHWSRTKRVRTNLPNLPARSYIIPEPYGVCLVIGAWNYPYQLSIAPVVAVLAAGNTVILKPSELSANTSALMAELINSNFAPEVFHVVEGGVTETTALLEQKFDKIFFTGSVPVGNIVYQAAAKNLTPVTLELGGKSPAFVFADTHLKVTAKRIVWGKFLNAGQTCIAPDYVLVENKIKDGFLKAVKSQIEQFRYSFDNKNYVQIINERNFQRLTALIDKEKVFCGGESDEQTRFISPTVLSNVDFNHLSMQDEIFGPILPVIGFDNLETVVAEVKNRSKPLACYVFTRSKLVRRKILHAISFGGGAANDTIMHISNSRLPFGGVGHSGTGSYHGEAGFRTFSHYKSVLQKPFRFEPNLKYPPYTEGKKKWIKRFLK
ncbi:MAG: aldehyde dehydrogenase [Bacteroidetes bacterium HGW-Bacteroidetes-6]|jgi:aldehyde dehydrogenase (NAD+)|nr:MAG: aldehyde dehydrogenase [Bacteroidetes bacterium HGW-Bacteroidetes-6]